MEDAVGETAGEEQGSLTTDARPGAGRPTAPGPGSVRSQTLLRRSADPLGTRVLLSGRPRVREGKSAQGDGRLRGLAVSHDLGLNSTLCFSASPEGATACSRGVE